MREEVLRLAGPAYTSRVQPAGGNTAAVELCTLLLADQEYSVEHLQDGSSSVSAQHQATS
ncbi:hypothetical protein HaLaN_05343 [Haematococcus lacustris]|uniref:Uncharacterized protein n=1 Tax=Haematococcus lacustris TaxID=44745 RepID=A0A699Z3T7_HAELA|nr:hypothetical protein HaLaN_05343 [Haematococcus lacustris]